MASVSAIWGNHIAQTVVFHAHIKHNRISIPLCWTSTSYIISLISESSSIVVNKSLSIFLPQILINFLSQSRKSNSINIADVALSLESHPSLTHRLYTSLFESVKSLLLPPLFLLTPLFLLVHCFIRLALVITYFYCWESPTCLDLVVSMHPVLYDHFTFSSTDSSMYA